MKSDTLIRFNWEKILKVSNYDCSKAYKLLKKIITEGNSKQDTNILDCWLVDPVGFLFSKATVQQKCVYLHLATKRDWINFTEYNTTGLPTYIVSEFYLVETLKSNPLLTITNRDIIEFNY